MAKENEPRYLSANDIMHNCGVSSAMAYRYITESSKEGVCAVKKNKIIRVRATQFYKWFEKGRISNAK